jgi:hypothetical protein
MVVVVSGIIKNAALTKIAARQRAEMNFDFLRRHDPHQVLRVHFPRGNISVC